MFDAIDANSEANKQTNPGRCSCSQGGKLLDSSAGSVELVDNGGRF